MRVPSPAAEDDPSGCGDRQARQASGGAQPEAASEAQTPQLAHRGLSDRPGTQWPWPRPNHGREGPIYGCCGC